MKSVCRLFLHFRRILLPAAMLVIVMSGAASAAALRGRVERKEPNGSRVPAAGVTVTVYSQSTGRSPSHRTDSDGMYYFTVPAGSYRLEIWPNPASGAKPLRYQIPRVVEPYTDIQPIVLP